MRADKRLWIYSGLGVPEGVALVRRPPRRKLERRVLLVGGLRARQLAPLVARLAQGAGASLHVDSRPGASTRDWAATDWLPTHLAVYRPTHVLLVLDPRDVLARRVIRAKVRRAGGETFWLVPPGVPHEASPRFIAAPGDDARSLAAWAAKAWGVVG